MNITLGVAAHVDAGKTTLIEQILLNTNAIREAGRVDKKNSFLDYHEIEKKRGITVFSEEAHVPYKNSVFHIVDTPGHVDFSSELERSISVMDMCILIISAADMVTSHTKTIWKLLRKNNIPTFIFINKLDIVGTSYSNVLKSINENLSDRILCITEPIYHNNSFEGIKNNTDNISDHDFIEQLANLDDNILERYINEAKIEVSQIENTITKSINSCNAFPVFSGVGLRNIGIVQLLDFADKYIITDYNENSEFSGFIYKIRYDENMQKQTFIKVMSGKIKIKDTIQINTSNQNIEEDNSTPTSYKINQINIYHGNTKKAVNELSAGEYGAIPMLTDARISNTFGNFTCRDFSLTPTLKSKVVFNKEKYDKTEIFNLFKILTDEDPLLAINQVKELDEIHVNIMGTIQLEVLKDVILERFKTVVDFEKPKVIYKETIADEVTGMGHFEPYKHYAEVTLKITPAKRNSGISYKSSCHVDNLPLRWQKMFERVIPYACKRGVLTGSELTDINIEMIDGKHSIKHTSSGDFKEATFRAVRKATVSSNSLLLEPYYKYSITVENELSGKIMTDITSMCGSFEIPQVYNSRTTIEGIVPVSEFIEYPSRLLSLTKGDAQLSFSFYGYDICHDTDAVIERIGYDSNADKEFTAHSIYCANGHSYSVE